jgi:hypothetical protein
MVGALTLERFEDRIGELEATIKEIAIDITTGTFVEKLSSGDLWEKLQDRVKLVTELVHELGEYLFMLKPERIPTIQKFSLGIQERLDLFEENLMKNIGLSEAPKKAVEEMRQALVDVSEFVSFCRTVRKEPSEVIHEILVLRENQATDSLPMTQEKMHRLGSLVKDAQSNQREATMVTAKMESQLEALRSEYDRLLYGLKKKDEPEEN